MKQSDPPDWPFDDEPLTACFTTTNVLAGEAILYVWHYASDSFFLFSDQEDIHDLDDIRIVALTEMLSRDPSIRSVAQLPLGYLAWRQSPSQPWSSEPFVEGRDDPDDE